MQVQCSQNSVQMQVQVLPLAVLHTVAVYPAFAISIDGEGSACNCSNEQTLFLVVSSHLLTVAFLACTGTVTCQRK